MGDTSTGESERGNNEHVGVIVERKVIDQLSLNMFTCNNEGLGKVITECIEMSKKVEPKNKILPLPGAGEEDRKFQKALGTKFVDVEPETPLFEYREVSEIIKIMNGIGDRYSRNGLAIALNRTHEGSEYRTSYILALNNPQTQTYAIAFIPFGRTIETIGKNRDRLENKMRIELGLSENNEGIVEG